MRLGGASVMWDAPLTAGSTGRDIVEFTLQVHEEGTVAFVLDPTAPVSPEVCASS